MITEATKKDATARALEFYEAAHIVLTEEEKQKIEIADFGLNQLEETGLQLLTYVNTERVCAKEMVLFPEQTCPEHRHPAVDGKDGKEETFRVRYGSVSLYVEGEQNCTDPAHPEGVYTVFHEVVLHAGEQYTIYPNTKHWFRGGPEGAVVSEFSTRSTDENDVFSDPRIIR